MGTCEAIPAPVSPPPVSAVPPPAIEPDAITPAMPSAASPAVAMVKAAADMYVKPVCISFRNEASWMYELPG